MARPDFIKPELLEMLPVYKLCRDCYSGDRAVKGRVNFGAQSVNNGAGGGRNVAISPYLPDPSPSTESDEIKAQRYNDYVTRAVFYNVTRRTVAAMAGAVFSKYPNLQLGDLTALETDVDGAGQSLMQQAKDAFTNCLLTGRGGFLADMPVIDGASRAQVSSGSIRPNIAHYCSESIINWRYRTFNGIKKTSLIVLAETYVDSDDGFEQTTKPQLLVLRLNDSEQVESEIYRKTDKGWQSLGVNLLKDGYGKPLTEIPFYVYGAVNNDLEPDDSPIYDVAQLNIAHFRNSADYEEGNFIAGQPTLVVTGLTQDWVDDVLDGGIAIGARSGIMLPANASASLLQATANNALMESMLHKEKQMTALGAKLIENNKQAKTATEAAQDSAEESNTLTNMAYNLSDAYTKAVKACARYMRYDDKDVVVTLNTNFNFAKMDAQARAQLVAEWQSGAITFGEMRGALVESEIATIENAEDAANIIKQEQGALMTQDLAD